MNTVQASAPTQPPRQPSLVRRRMGLADKLGLTICLILAFAVGLSSLLNYFNFQSTYNSLVRSSYMVMLRDMGYRIQYGLGLGLSLPSLDNIPEMLMQAIDSEPTLSFVQVFDTRGEVLFHTDTRAIGTRVPEDWQARAFRTAERESLWSTTTATDYIVGIPLINSFNQIEGALVLAYPLTQTADVFARMQRGLLEQSLIVIAVFGVLSVLCAVFVLRRLTRSLRRLESSLDEDDGSRTESAGRGADALEDEFRRFRRALTEAKEELEQAAQRQRDDR